MTEKWKVANDSLYMTLESKRWKNDSLHIHGFNGESPKVPEKPLIFLIEENHLIYKWQEIIKGEERKMVIKLKQKTK